MESKHNEEIAEQFSEGEEEEELDYEELTSHKIDKNVVAQKKRKRLIVILDHA